MISKAMNRVYLLSRVNHTDYPRAQKHTNKACLARIFDLRYTFESLIGTISFRCNSKESIKCVNQNRREKSHLNDPRGAALIIDPAIFQNMRFPTKSAQIGHSIDRKILSPSCTLHLPLLDIYHLQSSTYPSLPLTADQPSSADNMPSFLVLAGARMHCPKNAKVAFVLTSEEYKRESFCDQICKANVPTTLTCVVGYCHTTGEGLV